MSKQELRAYILQNRNDNDAIYAMVKRISEKPGKWYSMEDADCFAEIYAQHHNDRSQQVNK